MAGTKLNEQMQLALLSSPSSGIRQGYKAEETEKDPDWVTADNSRGRASLDSESPTTRALEMPPPGG